MRLVDFPLYPFRRNRHKCAFPPNKSKYPNRKMRLADFPPLTIQMKSAHVRISFNISRYTLRKNAPGWIRTTHAGLRRAALYPSELQAQITTKFYKLTFREICANPRQRVGASIYVIITICIPSDAETNFQINLRQSFCLKQNDRRYFIIYYINRNLRQPSLEGRRL